MSPTGCPSRHRQKGNDVTEFAKQTYKDMSTANRVRIWMIKASEFFEFSRLMTNEDAKFLKRVLDVMIKEEA